MTHPSALILVAVLTLGLLPTPVAAQKARVLVLTDIENEPDDAMSMVRFLIYSNQWDVEGLVATTSTHQKDKTAAWRIRQIVEAVRQGPRQPGEARARLSHGGLSAVDRSRGPAGLRHGGGRGGHGLARLRSDHRSRRPRRSAPAVGHRVGRPQLPRAGALESARDALSGGTAEVRRQAARLHDLRPGRQRAVAAEDVSCALLHRQPRHPCRRRVSPCHVDRYQRRPVPRPVPGRRLQPSSTIRGSTGTSAARDRSAHSIHRPRS